MQILLSVIRRDSNRSAASSDRRLQDLIDANPGWRFQIIGAVEAPLILRGNWLHNYLLVLPAWRLAGRTVLPEEIIVLNGKHSAGGGDVTACCRNDSGVWDLLFRLASKSSAYVH